MTSNIDHRQHLQPAEQASLGIFGIFANTVNPSVPKQKKQTLKEKQGDEAVTANKEWRLQLQRAAQGLLPKQRVHHC